MSYVQRWRFSWAFFLCGLVLLVLGANATTLARLELQDLATKSTAVARLRCLTAKSEWDKGEIWTETKFEVVQREKGSLPKTVTIRLLGGRVGHVQSHVDEVPVFQAGEEVYLFLWNRESQPYSVLGWSQGTFRIARNPQTGAELVTQDSAATPIFDPQAGAFRAEGIRNMPIATFREKLRTAFRGENHGP
jgi:hypothetical protein